MNHKERLLAEAKEINLYREGHTTLPHLTQEQFEDYINEAEHQDGEEYWLLFTDGRQVYDDMLLYHSHGEDTCTS